MPIKELIILSIGLLPSFVWLLFYLRKDSHPESNRLILKIFILGILSGFFAIFLERGFQDGMDFFGIGNLLFITFLATGIIEEVIKFLAVKAGLYKVSEPDEPIDWLLFMIISALGFAALENVLVLASQEAITTSKQAIEVMAWRFISATFLHALCSGAIGYFWILSHYKNKKAYLWLGFLGVASLHAFYNWSIIREEQINILLPLVVILALSLFLSFGIKHLKKLKSVCNIK